MFWNMFLTGLLIYPELPVAMYINWVSLWLENELKKEKKKNITEKERRKARAEWFSMTTSVQMPGGEELKSMRGEVVG